MGWDIKVSETSCPYALVQFANYNCSNWINKTGNCNEDNCPVKIELNTDMNIEIISDNQNFTEIISIKEKEC